MKYNTSDVKKLGTILGVWAHPDDEIFSCAGLMHAACLNGQKVISITATFGDAGESANEEKWPKAQLAEIRKKESENAMEIIGEVEQHWLGYKDGKLKEVDLSKVVNEIHELLAGQKIDTIITFEEQGITGHDDHKTVHKWSKKLADKLVVANILCSVESQEFYESYGKKLHDKHNIYFNIDIPKYVSKNEADICFELSEECKEIKLKALKAHASQTSGLFRDSFGREAVIAMTTCESFIKH
jgi:LmbE family N-acetylglucosaminyl deacetylase